MKPLTIVRAAVCAFLLLPGALLAQRGGPAAGPARDPMQELLPLKPTRTLAFTTKVGNWMSSDVSPDGKTIVFDLLGDLYLMPISGGKATAFTRGMGFDGQPRFSPDGKSIVYVSDRTGGYNLWTISLDKKDTVQITTGNATTYQSPAWTPDGKYIVASRANRLWLFPATGGTGIQLIRDSASAGGPAAGGGGGANVTREEGPAFGKDPRYIYYAERRGSWVYNTPLGDYDLQQYDRETGRVVTKENRWGSAFRPTLSPDGKWLVYGTRYVDHTRLRVRNLLTNEEDWLTGPVQRDDQESRATLDVYPGMSFTPDSKHLVTTWDGRLWKVTIDTKQATEIPFEADVVQALGPHVGFEYRIPDSTTFVAKQIRDATPSPDGKKLAFVAMDRLYVMDYPNGAPKRLTSTNRGEFEPTWSPDGQWIAYTTWDDSIGYLNRMRSDGSGRPQRLTPQEGLWTNPTYTPNGQRIVATRSPSRSFRTGGGGGGGAGGRGGSGELMWLPAAGGPATFIANSTGDVHFSARDTSRIFAYSGQRGLYSMRWDGTDIKEILRIQGPPAPGGGGGRGAGASWAQISPDGQRALAMVNLDLFYIPDIPWPGGPVPTITVGGGGGGGGDAPAGGGAAFPSRKLTDIGAQFPQWGAGDNIHWSIGNAHVVYDIPRAIAFDDSVRRANPPRAAAAGGPDSAADTPAAGRGGRGGRPALATYKPVETRIRVMAERDIPRATAVLRGARIITMNGTQVIEKGDIVVTDNRITAIGPSGTLTVPAGAREIDVAGKTISPGFVDTHAHLRVANNVHRDPVWSYAANLAYGVTTARDPQTGSTDVLTYEDQEKAGKVLAPRIYSTGPGVFAAENIRNIEDARRVLKRYAEYYDTKTIKEYQTGNREVRQWVIQAANELKLMPTTEGGLDYKMNITEAIDGYSGHEHTIPTYPLQSDVIRLLSESGIAYTPTIIVAYGAPWAENYWYEKMDMLNDSKLQLFTPWSDLEGKILRRGGSPGAVTTMGQAGWFHDTQYPMKLVGSDIKRLIDAGGSAGVGSHGQQQGIGYHWELWSIGMGDGMTPMDAMKVATRLGAEALGLGKDVGSIEVGKMADLVVFDRNPLEDLKNTVAIKYVMKNGRLYDATNLDEVYPRKVKGAPFPWNEDESPTRDKLMRP